VFNKLHDSGLTGLMGSAQVCENSWAVAQAGQQEGEKGADTTRKGTASPNTGRRWQRNLAPGESNVASSYEGRERAEHIQEKEKSAAARWGGRVNSLQKKTSSKKTVE